jgi:hypothetical protein
MALFQTETLPGAEFAPAGAQKIRPVTKKPLAL